MKEHLIIQLLHRHYTGELDAKDNDLLMDWLQESPENQNFGSSIKEIWDLSKNYQATPSFESKTDSAFAKFSNSIAKESQAQAAVTLPTKQIEKVAIVRSISYPKWITGVAAILAIAATGFWFLQQDNTNHQLAVLDTLSDQQEKVVLLDNSQLYVNEKSTVRYFTDESESVRNVELEGEAFFEVSKSDRPFVITTANATVTVLGTEFNVNSDETMTEVSVKSGRVELRPLNSTHSIELTANQIGIYDAVNKKLYRKQSKSFNGNSWQSGGFSFEDASLDEVFATLENHYDVDIYVENSEIKTCIFTSPVYQDAPITEVLKVIEIIYHITFEIDEDDDKRIIIRGGECR